MAESYKSIESMLVRDCIEKKKAGRGVYSRASRSRGFRGGVLFPSDLLSAKEKREYKKATKAEVYNMYDDIKNIPSLKELEEMPHDTARKIIETARSKHMVKDLSEHWGIGRTSVYSKVFSPYGVKTKQYKTSKQDSRNVSTYDTSKSEGRPVITEVSDEASKPKSGKSDKVSNKDSKRGTPYKSAGLNLEYDAIDTGENSASRITDLVLVLEEDINYHVNLSITQLD